ncbi:DUF7286 family protein [Haladaptatus salinisoli]|uniref:DUF7286 family protein n=1 Tax=Haladaptatus salinisoli TaxID=2884876 RepID=UPI001D0A336B|nr:hypothetical protein [Haladaptatus salinisoli]
MRLADDTRGRVPFALVGVLLLVGSATLAGTLASRPPSRTNGSVDRAMSHVTAGAQTALRDAVQRAGRDAAAQPLVRPANTTAGSVIDGSEPFRDYLRLRIYLTARTSLRAVSVRVGDVRASARLAPTPNASALRRAKRRVHVEPVGNATDAGLRVRIENVSLRASRDGSVVARTSRNVTLVVATPVLALHERVRRFERRLARGPLEPGLGRRLTARLYAVAWARGYAQYGGAPIGNVVGNRHVELMTNGAILREQRSAFGRSDPAARRALRRATARVGLTDLLVPTTERGKLWADTILNTAGPLRDEPADISAPSSTHAPGNETVVGVNESADRALLDLIGDGESDEKSEFDAAVASAYRVTVRPAATVRTVRDESRPEPRPPGANWTLVERHAESRSSVDSADGRPPGTPEGWHLLWTDARRVVRTHTVVRRWKLGNRTTRTTRRWTDEFVVSLGVAGDHVTTEYAPPRPLPTAHEPSGPESGPNLADVGKAAVQRLVHERGGADELALRAVDETLDTRPQTIRGRFPGGLRSRTYRDVRALRSRIRNLSVTVSRGDVATGRVNPATELARKLRVRRSDFVGAPAAYDGAAERARYAVRAAYVDSVLERLDDRAERVRRTRKGLGKAVRDATGVPLERIRRILAARERVETSTTSRLPASGPGGRTNISVDGAPPYLTLTAVEHRHVSTVPKGERVHPMAARNINVFTVPSADVRDGIVALLPGARDATRVGVRTSARALEAANRTLAATANESLRKRRDALQRSLARSLDGIERGLLRELGATGLARSERRAAVRRGLAHWNTTTARALAVSNGSAARRIALVIESRKSGRWNRMRRDRVALRVRAAVETARREASGVKQSVVAPAVKNVEQIVAYELKKAVKRGVENGVELAQKRWVNETMSNLAAGMPVAPVPGYWYATVNVWRVDVSGTYARFTVRARQGPPTSPGASVAYTRRNRTVRMDVDGDGAAETLGRTTPVAFDTWTTVVVAVPPGKTGVGDVNGDADERSPGWTNRSDNPFGSRARRGEHALRRDRRSR